MGIVLVWQECVINMDRLDRPSSEILVFIQAWTSIHSVFVNQNHKYQPYCGAKGKVRSAEIFPYVLPTNNLVIFRAMPLVWLFYGSRCLVFYSLTLSRVATLLPLSMKSWKPLIPDLISHTLDACLIKWWNRQRFRGIVSALQPFILKLLFMSLTARLPTKV